MEWDEALDLFIKAQDYAKVKHEEATLETDKLYWQGVKDGLRRCFSIFTNDPKWDVVARTMNRPEDAYGRWSDG